MKFRNIFLTFLLIFSCNLVYAHEIALTFDDLPEQRNDPADKQREINERILKGLDKFNAPAIGFVNEGKLYTRNEAKEKIAILKSWIDKGHPLGNHTYSHHSINKISLEEYENDVIMGAKVSRELMNNAGLEYRYFRHPFLDTGATKEIRTSLEKFLTKEGYIIAPVTIDTEDWKFNKELLNNEKNKDKIIQQYLDHTRARFAFYEKASKEMFGRNIKHTWLLHVNLLNSYAIEDILKIAKEMGYTFITLDKALEDNAYSEPDHYYGAYGVLWLYRWDFTRGKVVDWTKEPEPDFKTLHETKT